MSSVRIEGERRPFAELALSDQAMAYAHNVDRIEQMSREDYAICAAQAAEVLSDLDHPSYVYVYGIASAEHRRATASGQIRQPEEA